jgi:hypothetical protein
MNAYRQKKRDTEARAGIDKKARKSRELYPDLWVEDVESIKSGILSGGVGKGGELAEKIHRTVAEH